MIAPGSYVADLKIRKRDPLDRFLAISPVVEIEAVAGLSPHLNMAHSQSGTAREMPRVPTADKDRREIRIQRGDREFGDAIEMMPARIFSGTNEEAVTLGQLRERGVKFVGTAHGNVGGRERSGDEENWSEASHAGIMEKRRESCNGILG